MKTRLSKFDIFLIVLSFLILLSVILLIIFFSVTSQSVNPYFCKEDTPLNKTSNVSIVIHTFDGYRRYWEGVIHFLQKYYIHQTSIIYFANEELDIDLPPFFKQIKCGKGEWGYRLINALNQIPTKYVVYLQEDMWLTQYLHQRYFDEVADYMDQHNLISVKLFSKCEHVLHLPENLNNPKWYVGTHQPSMWNKEYLLSTLDSTMSPFRHETSLNRRLHKNDNEGERVLCASSANPSFYQVLSYEDVSRQGKLRKVGEKMLKKEGLHFSFNKDEVFYRAPM